jgi:hypothetical protein
MENLMLLYGAEPLLRVQWPASTVISNSGMSLERSEIGEAKRVDPL